ncbi:hypothetical protein L288_12400 [Sphingobium quisquiliarum P25]|uniref:Uncharacterized protein n=1 Tax=Sphingobium quisquiliarum P25 TaxID=1329909 RepID=T0GY89_9SPHN|nr:hypothetical protein L288_12400 [Sphingobium quisquiliarum P25]
MRGILRPGVQCALDHLIYLRLRYRAWPTSAILIGQPFKAILREPPTPLANGVFVHAKAFGNFLALKCLGT